MTLLLDTHILLWAAAEELPETIAPYINDRENMLLFSSASLWEVAIKNGFGRKDFSVDPASLYSGLLYAGYKELAVSAQHVLSLSDLPNFHKDPFDRILIAQAISERIALLTADKIIAKYPGPIIRL